MKKNLKATISQIVLLASFLLIGPAAVTLAQAPAPAPSTNTSEEVRKSLCGGANLTFSDGVDSASKPEAGGNNLNRSCDKDANPQTKVNNLITQIVNVFSVIVGIAAVIMMIYGGFRYITSGGDSNAISSAKNTILYAIVGLIIVAIAQFIVKFVLNKATQAPTPTP